MVSNKASDFEREWLRIRKSLSDKKKILLEILTFAFIAAHSSKSDINVEKITKSVIVGNELKESLIYKMTVKDE
ncbi:hypothetical protein [Enterococcus sp. AZ126]|uniref:hypothetical protein n=1 Tax=Enterococcus sp. AZ126 TaxID=2774635 RepID=UPI003F2856FC